MSALHEKKNGQECPCSRREKTDTLLGNSSEFGVPPLGGIESPRPPEDETPNIAALLSGQGRNEVLRWELLASRARSGKERRTGVSAVREGKADRSVRAPADQSP